MGRAAREGDVPRRETRRETVKAVRGRRARVLLVVLPLAVLVGGAVGLWGQRRETPVPAPSTASGLKPLRTHPGRLALRNSFPKLKRPPPTDGKEPPSAEEQAALDAQQARREIDDLFAQLRSSKHDAERTPELAVNSIGIPLGEWAQRIYRQEPYLLRPLATEIEGRLCGPLPRPAELILLSKVQYLLPQLTSQRGFDCVFSRHEQEDIVTWSLLDSWRHSGLDLSPPLAALQQRASDGRTLRRFMTADQELELRSRRARGDFSR
jgi:hypothetical protein